MAEGEGAGYSIPGLAQMMQYRNAQNANAVANIGTFAGGLTAAAIGANQASQDPGVFGEGTTPTGAAALAGLMNFNNAVGGGGGGGGGGVDMNGFARLVQGGGTGTGGAAGTNFASFAAAGKLADATRNLLKENTPTLPNQDDVPVMGFTDDQWAHLGTADKVQAFQATKAAMDQKLALQGYDMGQQHMAEAASKLSLQKQQIDAANAAVAANAKYNQGVTALTAPLPVSANPMSDPNSPVKSPWVNLANGALANPQPLDGAEMQRLAAAAGMTPQAQLDIERGALLNAKAKKDLTEKTTFFDPNDMGKPVPGIPGLMRVPTGPNTSELRDTSGNVATPVTDEDGKTVGYTTAGAKGQTIFKPIKASGPKFSLIADPLNPGHMIPTVSADNLEDFKKGTEALKQWNAENGQPPAPGNGATADGNTPPPAASPPASPDKELIRAQQAIAAGTPRAAVAALYQQRTGKPLPTDAQ